MSSHSPSPEPGRSISTARLGGIRILLTIAAIVDGYLAWVSASGSSVAGCGPDSACQAVLNSRWAYWFGLPVSVPALLVYATLLMSSFGLDPKNSPQHQRMAWEIVLPCSALVIGAALWFVSLQLFVLRTICPFCMTAHGCALLGSLLLLIGAPIRNIPVKARGGKQRAFVPAPLVLKELSAAGIALAVLIGGQLLHQPKTFAAKPIVAGVTTNAVTPAVRKFQVFDGQFEFNLREVPLLGRPEAPHVMVSLFDYTCEHCRQMHGTILEAYHQFSNELAIINLPMPLDGNCNSLVKHTQSAHTNACELARIGLTVWGANRQMVAQFDDWVFAPDHPPPPVAAEQYARQLVGAASFEKAATNSWIAKRIQEDVLLYTAVYRKFRQGVLPELIIGTNLISGIFNREQLFTQLSDQFGLNTNRQELSLSHAPAR